MIPERIRHWQLRRGLTNQAAAATLGVPLRTFEDYRAGRRTPRGLALEMLLQKLGAADSSAPNAPLPQ